MKEPTHIDVPIQTPQFFDDIPVQGSVYTEKRFNVQRVPSIQQVAAFFRLMPFGSRWHAYFTVAFFCGLRPIEICNLTTDMVVTDGKQWVGLIYPVGKPKPPGRPKKGETPGKATRKWNRVDERRGDIPAGALESLRTYWMRERQQFGTLFPKAYKQYGKSFSLLRKKMIANGYDNWGASSDDYFRNLKSFMGSDKTEYDITPYSGRRFFVSCYHWLRSSENRNRVPDLIETQKRMAHTGSKDTQIYVYPWRDLGLEPHEIGQGWAVLTGQDPGQLRLNEYWEV